MYCQVVRAPWEQAIWLYEASDQNVDWMDGVGDTPQTVTTIGADEEDEEAAIHISLDGYDTMGIGYIAL